MTNREYLVPITAENAVAGIVGSVVAVTGEKLQLVVVYLDPGEVIEWHSHPHETMVTLVEGEYDVWIGDEQFTLKPGWALWIPSDVPHRAVVGDQPVVEIEAFSPPRKEYAELMPDYDFRTV